MTPIAEEQLDCSSFFEVLCFYVYTLSNIILHHLGLTSNESFGVDLDVNDELQSTKVAFCFSDIEIWLSFDEFQFKILKAFSLILLTNIILIYFSWKTYGLQICQRFMKPGRSTQVCIMN